MRHWNNDHKLDDLPRDCKFPENVISPCFICETVYAEGKNHRCQTRKNHRKCLRNQLQHKNVQNYPDSQFESQNNSQNSHQNTVNDGNIQTNTQVDSWSFFDNIDICLFLQQNRLRVHETTVPLSQHENWQKAVKSAEKIAISTDPIQHERGFKAIFLLPTLLLHKNELLPDIF